MIPRNTDPFTADEYRALEAYDHEQERRRKAEAKRARVDRRTFRERLIDVLHAVDDAKNLVESRVWNLEDAGGGIIGPCPSCGSKGSPLSVRFRGRKDVVTLECHAGCSEQEVAQALRSHPVWHH